MNNRLMSLPLLICIIGYVIGLIYYGEATRLADIIYATSYWADGGRSLLRLLSLG